MLLEQRFVDLEAELSRAKHQVAVAIADERRLRTYSERERQDSAQWEQRALLAARAGDDELAMRGLEARQQHEHLAAYFEEQWQQQCSAVATLKDSLRGCYERFDEAKRSKNVLIARKRRAQALKSIQETTALLLGPLETNSPFERVIGQIDELEAEAELASEFKYTPR